LARPNLSGITAAGTKRELGQGGSGMGIFGSCEHGTGQRDGQADEQTDCHAYVHAYIYHIYYIYRDLCTNTCTIYATPQDLPFV